MTTVGRRYSPLPSIRVRCAPSEPSSRRAASTTSRSTASGERMLAIEALILASVRCASTRRASSSCERARRSISCWLAIAAAAWSASARRSATSASSKSSMRDEYAPSAPSTLPSAMSGAAAMERMLAIDAIRSAVPECGKRLSRR